MFLRGSRCTRPSRSLTNLLVFCLLVCFLFLFSWWFFSSTIPQSFSSPRPFYAKIPFWKSPTFSAFSLTLDHPLLILISMQPSVLIVPRFSYLPCFADDAGLALKHTEINRPFNYKKIEIHYYHRPYSLCLLHTAPRPHQIYHINP